MEFLKNNWAKILLIASAVAGAVLMIIPMCLVGNIKIWAVMQIIGPLFFFLGMAA